MDRILIVSNRLPVTVEIDDGEVELTPSVGGLATGLSSVYRDYESLWIGWPGIPAEDLDEETSSRLSERLLSEHKCVPVGLSAEDIEVYYEGFSNRTIWPLFHYFTQYTTYEDTFWQAYVRVNRAFADAILEIARPGDAIWVHDYHLMLLPEMIRQRLGDATIGFFLHIPFPGFETFRLLPWRLELISGLLGSDLVGFHTFDYAKHFLVTVRNLVGHEHAAGEIHAGRRVVKVDAFPMGIDYARFRDEATSDRALAAKEDILARTAGRKTILSVDRLDYSKGILQRIDAIEAFFEFNPQYLERVQVILVAVPSRTEVTEYETLKRSVDEAVGRVNGRLGTIGWSPIEYLYTSLDFPELVALYDVADVCLVTPLRDGMNLIAKEYLASNTSGKGVLVLSEMAGAAKELGEALMVNPNNTPEVAGAIRGALEMPDAQRLKRSAVMRQRLERYDVSAWAKDFVDSMEESEQRRAELRSRSLGEAPHASLVERYRDAKERLLFIDYDGTIVGLAGSPSEAVPDSDVCELLSTLASDPANKVVVVSGRDRESLDDWLGETGVDMVAEHGAFSRQNGGDWQVNVAVPAEWKVPYRPVLERFVDRTPGAFIEEKEFSLVWHYRGADPELAAARGRELKDAVLSLTAHLDISITEDSKVLEVRSARVNEGLAVEQWLTDSADFVLAIGDDWTDEDLFAAMPDDAYSIKVGLGPSRATWNLPSVEAVRELLRDIAG